jgi:phosphohistidine phosphatase SixA
MSKSGLYGTAYQKKADGTIGLPIVGVKITFVNVTSRSIHTATTGRGGAYRIALSPGKYVAVAQHAEYESYSTAPGYVVVLAYRYGVFNVFLRKIGATTVLLLRHAEPDYGQGGYDPPLSQAGQARAQKLIHVVTKVQITGLYTTNTQRTRQTIEPLAQSLSLTPIVYGYNGLADLAAKLRMDHVGEAALVITHAPTIPEIINELGGDGASCMIGNEFDNLFVVTLFQSDRVETVNLQYGQPTP